MEIDVQSMAEEMNETGRLQLEKEEFQHGNTTVYEHSLHVAKISLQIAESLPVKVDKMALVRGALLHDYFLYDWHNNETFTFHAFRHPYIALRNAERDFELGLKERNIILRHMFPLTPIPPLCIEAWIVCIVDKYCALGETVYPIVSRYGGIIK